MQAPHTDSPVTANDILTQAKQHMADRANTYDKPSGERSMAATVDTFIAVTGDGALDTEERGYLFMCLLKMVRNEANGPHRDSIEDLVAYAGLMGEATFRSSEDRDD